MMMETLVEEPCENNLLSRVIHYLIRAVSIEYLTGKLGYCFPSKHIPGYVFQNCPYCEKATLLRFVRVNEDTDKLEFCYYCRRCDTDYELWRDSFGEGGMCRV